jgi:protoporphyrinogen IX oxidase
MPYASMMAVLPVYEWLKVLHVLAVISWMAGLLYLPRLMVYHVAAAVGSDQDMTFKTMERRLLKAIMRPAAVVALLTGLGLIRVAGYGFGDVWLDIKLVALVGMFAAHGVLEKHVVAFARGERGRTGRYFRILNEVPTVLMVVIVIMVIVKPFA